MKNNNNKLIIFLLLSCLAIQQQFSQNIQQKYTLYFDASWKETTKENHEFYRLLPLKTIDSLSLIVDYYKNGNMQMQGYAYTNNLKELVGDIYWYDKEGLDYSHSQYINTTNKTLHYYHNNKSLWKTIAYKNDVKNGDIKIYNSKGDFVLLEKFKNGLIENDTIGEFKKWYYEGNSNRAKKINTNIHIPDSIKYSKALYWENTANIAKIITYQNQKNYNRKIKILEDKTYSKEGNLIKHFYEKDFTYNKPLHGEYYDVKTKNGFVIAIDTIRAKNKKSKVVNINNISYLKIHKRSDKVSFISKKDSNEYATVYYDLLSDIETNKKSFRVIENNDSNTFKLNELTYRWNYQLINVSDIKTQSVEEFLSTIENKEWIIKKGNKEKEIFKLYNSEIFSFLDLSYTTAYKGGFGSFLKQNDDDVNKWRINKAEFYQINIILVNGNKPILLLSQNGAMEYYIIPTIKKGLIVKFNDDEKEIKEKKSLDESIINQSIKYCYSSLFYGTKTKNKKKYLVNNFNEILINKPYDSIQPLGQFIIARSKKGIDIYNSKLDKLPFDKVKQVYYDRENLQILTNNSVTYINEQGKETNRKNISYSFCGTVGHTDFTLKKSLDKALNVVKISSDSYGISHTKILLFNNLDATHNITFLNGSKSDGYTGNSGFIDGYVNRTNLLVVSKDKKQGLYTYNHKDVVFKRKHEKDKNGIIDIDAPKYGSTSAKELLPVIYDKIELKAPLVIVKKNDKLGIYPLKKGLKYKSFGSVEVNFIPYETIDGEKGWIDVKTHEEFPNK